MEQLTQQLKSGKMEISEVPFPMLGKEQVLVRNHFSVISAGTEGKTVADARKGYIAKAKSRKKEVKMVLDMIRTEGLRKTYDIVMNKLEAPSPLGYSCSGEVIAIGDDVTDLQIGDRVACGGSGAYHADVVAVNRNLCVKIPSEIDLKEAAFSTIAAIAIQGIRQADLRFGENCTVIGLGLVGLITIEILKASGIQTIGVDINDIQVKKAEEIGADLALNRNHNGIVQTITDFTHGFGTDAVIITAGTSSLDPVEFAGEICRKKGRVVIVGAVPTGFSRPNYYRKELDLRMSSSYGPGRYDPLYEEQGIDYPIGYVRFTENRNMQTYVDLLAAKKISISPLITHIFQLQDAPQAYDLILSRNEMMIGMLIQYETQKEVKTEYMIKDKTSKEENPLNVGFIGAGNFAQNAVLPRIKDKVNLIGISTSKGTTSRYVGEKFGFHYCTDTPDKLISDSNIGTLFILTRHNTHAKFVIESLKAGKNVYVEKPLAMDMQELEMVKTAYETSGKGLMLGFNRRFSPLMRLIMTNLNKHQKKSINIRVNAGRVPSDHWVHDPQIGGGRIIGEVCHFIDLAYFLAGSKAKTIYAQSLGSSPSLNDTVNISLEFENGSVASIGYYSNGNKNVPKERVEVFVDGAVYIIDDFIKLNIITDKGVKRNKLKSQDKGHSESFVQTIQALEKGKTFPISFEEIYHSTMLTLEAIRSIKEKRLIWIE